jgi:hypothetical protein
MKPGLTHKTAASMLWMLIVSYWGAKFFGAENIIYAAGRLAG